MLNFESQPITPPPVGFDSGTDLESTSGGSVDVIRVDRLYQSTEVFNYESTDSLQSQKV